MIKRRRSLLDLPGEIRMIIYHALLIQHAPVQIKRRPLRIWCSEEQKWLLIGVDSSAHGSHQTHSGCRDQFNTDLCFRPDVHLHSAHFPCQKLLASPSDIDLNILCVCRQIYFEARHTAYAKNTFVTADLGSFSNFLYSLKAWQVESISHLSFNIMETRGMTRYLAEWNDTFSLIAASFFNLQTISIQVQLYDPRSACPSSFWDAGLLELDRLNLAAIEFYIVDRYSTPFFRYVAGDTRRFLHSGFGSRRHTHNSKPESIGSSTQSPRLERAFLHDCRDYLRKIHAYDKRNHADCHLFFRFSRNYCPLYVRNLIHLLPQSNRSHAQIRREDRLQREYTYRNAYVTNKDTGKAERFVGYQFGPDASEDDITTNVDKVHTSQHRLSDKIRSGKYETIKPPPRPVRDQRTSSSVVTEHATTQFSLVGSASGCTTDTTPLGQWRRRLNEEAFAPFMESFPPTKMVPKSSSNPQLYCAECTTFADNVYCFLSDEKISTSQSPFSG